MNAYLTKPVVLGTLAIVFGTALPSCVDPYAYGTAQQRPSPAYAPAPVYRTGYEVRTLPPGYRTEVISGNRYYTSNGVYYRPRSGRYVVVDAPRRTVVKEVYVRELPRGYRVVERGGRQYYTVRDTYYERRGGGYVVVNRPY